MIDLVISRERKWLIEWVGECRHRQPSAQAVIRLGEGSEHSVFLSEGSGNVLKLTRPGTYGDWYYLEDGRIAQASSTPEEYITRLRLVSGHFGLRWLPIGITATGQIVSRQRFILGEEPTQPQVDDFLVEARMMPVKQQFWLWKAEPVAGLEVWLGDARADNFVLTKEGVVPIDLRMWNVPVGGE